MPDLLEKSHTEDILSGIEEQLGATVSTVEFSEVEAHRGDIHILMANIGKCPVASEVMVKLGDEGEQIIRNTLESFQHEPPKPSLRDRFLASQKLKQETSEKEIMNGNDPPEGSRDNTDQHAAKHIDLSSGAEQQIFDSITDTRERISDLQEQASGIDSEIVSQLAELADHQEAIQQQAEALYTATDNPQLHETTTAFGPDHDTVPLAATMQATPPAIVHPEAGSSLEKDRLIVRPKTDEHIEQMVLARKTISLGDISEYDVRPVAKGFYQSDIFDIPLGEASVTETAYELIFDPEIEDLHSISSEADDVPVTTLTDELIVLFAFDTTPEQTADLQTSSEHTVELENAAQNVIEEAIDIIITTNTLTEHTKSAITTIQLALSDLQETRNHQPETKLIITPEFIEAIIVVLKEAGVKEPEDVLRSFAETHSIEDLEQILLIMFPEFDKLVDFSQMYQKRNDGLTMQNTSAHSGIGGFIINLVNNNFAKSVA